MASALATPSPFLKIIGIVFVIVGLFVLYKVFTANGEPPAPTAVSGPRGPKLAKGEIPDTVEETLRTFVSRVTTVESKLDKLSEDNSKIVGQSQAIQSNLEQQLQKKYGDLQAESDKKTQDLIQELKQNVEQAKVQSEEAKKAAAEAAAIKQAVTPAASGVTPAQPGAPIPTAPTPEETQIIWIKPGGEQQVQLVGTPAPTIITPGVPPPIPPAEEIEFEEVPAKTGTEAATPGGAPATAEKGPGGTRPVHTIPANATLLDSRAMTALIGRVPFQGSVVDPMRFKLIVGAENLATNGITIPRIVGIVAGGTAVGDWTLSCVRGTIDSMTFTFEDGTISTISGNMGTLSDPFGIPCVPGEKISNASQFLWGRLLAAGVTSVSEALGKAQITESPGGDGGEKSSNVTGSGPQYAALQGAKGAGKELTEYLKERQSQTFDVVFVRSGAPMAVHIDREIAIDYNPTGRKVFYDEVSGTQTDARLD